MSLKERYSEGSRCDGRRGRTKQLLDDLFQSEFSCGEFTLEEATYPL
jgi:hypothetical protein